VSHSAQYFERTAEKLIKGEQFLKVGAESKTLPFRHQFSFPEELWLGKSLYTTRRRQMCPTPSHGWGFPRSSLEHQAPSIWHSICARLPVGGTQPTSCPPFLCDSGSGLSDLLAVGFLLQLRCFLHQLAGPVCLRLGPFAFLAGPLTCGQFALRHELSLSHMRELGYRRG